MVNSSQPNVARKKCDRAPGNRTDEEVDDVLNHECAIDPLVQPPVKVRRGLADLPIGQLFQKIFHVSRVSQDSGKSRLEVSLGRG